MPFVLNLPDQPGPDPTTAYTKHDDLIIFVDTELAAAPRDPFQDYDIYGELVLNEPGSAHHDPERVRCLDEERPPDVLPVRIDPYDFTVSLLSLTDYAAWRMGDPNTRFNGFWVRNSEDTGDLFANAKAELATWNHYVQGEVYWYRVVVYQRLHDNKGRTITARSHYEDCDEKPLLDECCGDYYGWEDCEAAILGSVTDYLQLTAHGHQRVPA